MSIKIEDSWKQLLNSEFKKTILKILCQLLEMNIHPQ